MSLRVVAEKNAIDKSVKGWKLYVVSRVLDGQIENVNLKPEELITAESVVRSIKEVIERTAKKRRVRRAVFVSARGAGREVLEVRLLISGEMWTVLVVAKGGRWAIIFTNGIPAGSVVRAKDLAGIVGSGDTVETLKKFLKASMKSASGFLLGSEVVVATPISTEEFFIGYSYSDKGVVSNFDSLITVNAFSGKEIVFSIGTGRIKRVHLFHRNGESFLLLKTEKGFSLVVRISKSDLKLLFVLSSLVLRKDIKLSSEELKVKKTYQKNGLFENKLRLGRTCTLSLDVNIFEARDEEVFYILQNNRGTIRKIAEIVRKKVSLRPNCRVLKAVKRKRLVVMPLFIDRKPSCLLAIPAENTVRIALAVVV